MAAMTSNNLVSRGAGEAPVWENAAPPLPGAAMAFHQWRNNCMRIIPVLAIPCIVLSLVMVSDLTLLILQATAEGTAMIYAVPAVICSNHDSNFGWDTVGLELVVSVAVAGLWLGSGIRLLYIRSLPYCLPYDRVIKISVVQGRTSCTSSIITVVLSFVLFAASLIWLGNTFNGIRLTPKKTFGRKLGMPAHRLARGDVVGVDFFEGEGGAGAGGDAEGQYREEQMGMYGLVAPFSGGFDGQSSSSQHQHRPNPGQYPHNMANYAVNDPQRTASQSGSGAGEQAPTYRPGDIEAQLSRSAGYSLPRRQTPAVTVNRHADSDSVNDPPPAYKSVVSAPSASFAGGGSRNH